MGLVLGVFVQPLLFVWLVIQVHQTIVTYYDAMSGGSGEWIPWLAGGWVTALLLMVNTSRIWSMEAHVVRWFTGADPALARVMALRKRFAGAKRLQVLDVLNWQHKGPRRGRRYRV